MCWDVIFALGIAEDRLESLVLHENIKDKPVFRKVEYQLPANAEITELLKFPPKSLKHWCMVRQRFAAHLLIITFLQGKNHDLVNISIILDYLM